MKVILHWDELHTMSREEILSGACINSRFAYYAWDEIENWMKAIIQSTLANRSNQTVYLA